MTTPGSRLPRVGSHSEAAVPWPSWIVRATGRLAAVAGRWNGACGTASSSSRSAT